MKWSGIAMVFTVLLVFLTSAHAQGEAEWFDYDAVYGEVKSIDADKRVINIIEYDYDKEEEISVTYSVEEYAELENTQDLNGIKPGDWVDLEFYEDESGGKKAVYMALEVEPILENGTTDAEGERE